MRRLIYTFMALILITGIVLMAYAPDSISTVFIVLMEGILVAGGLFGILPAVQFYHGFETGMENIDHALSMPSQSTWAAMLQIDEFFHQRTMDEIFTDYRAKVKAQRESGQVLSDIDEFINEESLALRSWQNVIHQIPGSLTGLGLLGTFIGLIMGIRNIGFSTVSAALTSVQALLGGIQVAFYTSIAGLILSLAFNIMYRIAWNMVLRNMGLFTEEFHQNIIPTVDEQLRYREHKEIKQITDLLEKMSKGGVFLTVPGETPNTMTIGWGWIGYCWKKPVFVAAVRPQRHTYELIKKAGCFTVSVPTDNELKAELIMAGTKSGRDINKFEGHGITAVQGQQVNAPIVKECTLHFELRTRLVQEMTEDRMDPEMSARVYPMKDFHTIVFGESVDIDET